MKTYLPNWWRVYLSMGKYAANLAISDQIRGERTVEHWMLYGLLTNLLSVSNMQRGITMCDLDERRWDKVTFEEISRTIGR